MKRWSCTAAIFAAATMASAQIHPLTGGTEGFAGLSGLVADEAEITDAIISGALPGWRVFKGTSLIDGVDGFFMDTAAGGGTMQSAAFANTSILPEAAHAIRIQHLTDVAGGNATRYQHLSKVGEPIQGTKATYHFYMAMDAPPPVDTVDAISGQGGWICATFGTDVNMGDYFQRAIRVAFLTGTRDLQFESRQGISATPGTFQHVPAGASNTDNDDYPLNEWFKITIDFERFPDQVGTAKLYVNDVEKAQVSLGSDAQYSSDTFIRNQHFPQVTAHWLYNTTGWNCYVAAIAVNTGASGVEDWRLF